MQHNIVDILPSGLQMLLAKYLQESISSLWHENQATIGMENDINIFYKKTKTSENYKRCSRNYIYLFLHHFDHIMKHISLGNMHMNNISTILYDCLQQLE